MKSLLQYKVVRTFNFNPMEYLGKITNPENIKLLKMTLEQEKAFNDESVTFNPLLDIWDKNKEIYGEPLYEADRSFTFVDTDVFRQAAIHWETHNKQYTLLHPDYDRIAYNRFWDKEEYRRQNGMTAWAGIDKETGEPRLVHITGELYNFLNYCPIFRVQEEDIVIDEKVTAKDMNKMLKAQMKRDLKERFANINGGKVTQKKEGLPRFIDAQFHVACAKEFARRAGFNFFYGKARRKGQSYWNASNAQRWNDTVPSSTVVQAAFDKLYLTKGKGLFVMAKRCFDHINLYTDFYKNRLKDTEEHIKLGYYEKGSDVENGFKSETQAVSAQSNPDVTVGKDCLEIQYEELGKFPNFKDSFSVTTSTVEAGGYKIGQITGWGTGGTKDANWEAFEDVIYNPASYNNLPCNNVWDENAAGTACGYFYSHLDGLEDFLDEYGNTDFEGARKSHEAKRDYIRRKTTDERLYTIWCGQRACSPQEAFGRSSNNIFPTAQLQEQLNFLIRSDKYKYAFRAGVMITDDNGNLKLKTNNELREEGVTIHEPIVDFPLKRNTDFHGCIVEYQPPFRDVQGKIPKGLYVAVQDPYAHDKDVKAVTMNDSLGATYIYENINTFTPSRGGIIVASYIGRPPKMDMYNDQALMLVEYYNCKLMFENDRGDTKQHAKTKKKLDLLYEEPEMLFAKELSGKTGRDYGMHMTDGRKAKAIIYLRDMLTESLGKDEFTGKEKFFYSYIYDIGLLKELIKFAEKGNFDRVSAMLLLQFVIREFSAEVPKTASTQARQNKTSIIKGTRKMF